jgi:hypothetical protein
VDAQGNVYVADLGNKRIQVFDNDGNFKSQIGDVGAPWAICISPGAHQYLYSSNSNPPDSMDNGEIYKMELDGKVLGKFGTAGKLAKEFGTVNEIDCRNPNVLYAGPEAMSANLTNWRVQKLTLPHHPQCLGPTVDDVALLLAKRLDGNHNVSRLGQFTRQLQERSDLLPCQRTGKALRHIARPGAAPDYNGAPERVTPVEGGVHVVRQSVAFDRLSNHHQRPNEAVKALAPDPRLGDTLLEIGKALVAQSGDSGGARLEIVEAELFRLVEILDGSAHSDFHLSSLGGRR